MAHHARELSTRLRDFVGEDGIDSVPLRRARQAMLVRHRRKGYFDADLFIDPAWDMLLLLFVAYEEGQPISVGACCAGTGVSEVAAMRWIDVLYERGLVTLSDDAGTDRHRFIRLTDPSHHAMRDFWQEQAPI